jgi:hypothetical protein
MKRIRLVIFSAAVLAVVSAAGPLPPTIATIPASGNVVGPAGTVVGWGFTLSNLDPSDWVVLTGSSFTGSQVQGTYVDYLSLPTAPSYVAGPVPESSTVTQTWNGVSQLGLGEFDINPTAAPGLIGGNIVVHYSEFSQDPNDPNFDPDTSTVIADATLSAPVSISVAPEPGTIWLIFAGAVPLVFWRYQKARRG